MAYKTHHFPTKRLLFAVDVRGLVGDPQEALLGFVEHILNMPSDFFRASNDPPLYNVVPKPLVVLELNCSEERIHLLADKLQSYPSGLRAPVGCSPPRL